MYTVKKRSVGTFVCLSVEQMVRKANSFTEAHRASMLLAENGCFRRI